MDSISTRVSGAWARISRAACRPVMRGIDTSSTATFGRCSWVDSRAATPSSASATTSMSGWRSISIRRPERTMPWSSAIRTRIKTPPGGATAGRRANVELASGQARALDHAAQAEPRSRVMAVAVAGRRGRVEPGAVVAHAQLEPLLVSLDLYCHRRRACVAPDVCERLLQDPVDRRLHVLGKRVRLALGAQRHLDAGAG